MRTMKFAGAGLLTAALTATLLIAPAANAAPSGDKGSVARHSAATTKSEQMKVRGYWTPAKMRAAVPRERVVGKAGTKAGAAKSADAVQVPTQPQLGKVFFTLGAQDYVCSGTATSSTNGDVVTTAGHCLNEGPGGFATNFAFVPAYRDGARPFGVWVADELLTTTQWRDRGDFNYDVGFALMSENQAGRSLTDVVGSYPIAFNLGYGRTFDAYGYPAARPYDGQRLWRCSGATTRDVFSTANQLPCTMTGGSSGGGWITNGSLNSLNSFGRRNQRNQMFGPYFGDVAKGVYETAQVR